MNSVSPEPVEGRCAAQRAGDWNLLFRPTGNRIDRPEAGFDRLIPDGFYLSLRHPL